MFTTTLGLLLPLAAVGALLVLMLGLRGLPRILSGPSPPIAYVILFIGLLLAGVPIRDSLLLTAALVLIVAAAIEATSSRFARTMTNKMMSFGPALGIHAVRFDRRGGQASRTRTRVHGSHHFRPTLSIHPLAA